MAAEPLLNVHSVETFGTHDGPGIRLVLFLQGCPMRCVYCHNPDTRDCKPQAGTPWRIEQVMELLERQRPYFRSGGGLTVSGGEPTVQAEALIALFTEARARGFHTALDTNGAIRSAEVERLYDLTDLVILDVKHIDPWWHRKVTGMGNQNVLANAALREQSGKPLWLRYVLVPGWTDQPEFVAAWARHFAGYRSLQRVELIPYHTFGVHKYEALGLAYPLEGLKPPTAAQVEAIRLILVEGLGAHVEVVVA